LLLVSYRGNCPTANGSFINARPSRSGFDVFWVSGIRAAASPAQAAVAAVAPQAARHGAATFYGIQSEQARTAGSLPPPSISGTRSLTS